MKELDVVTLKTDVPEFALYKGAIGTIVFVHEATDTYMVEFLCGEEEPIIETFT